MLRKAKDVLERLEILAKQRQSSGLNVLNELQELMDMAGDAANEIYATEQLVEDMNHTLTIYERGGAA